MLRDKFKSPAAPECKNDRQGEPGTWQKEWTEMIPQVPDGMFRKCGSCKKILYEKDVRDLWYCCPRCGTYFRIDPMTRIRMTADVHSFQEWDTGLMGENPLDFPEYGEKLEQLRAKTGLADAVVTGRVAIRGIPVAMGAMSPDFLMGSMGWAVGERLTRMIERAEEERLPVVLFCCSGGARMQEGIVSLMQMAKVSQALKRYSESGGFYIPVLTDPTMGGVTASFAMLGDIILAEPGAMIGFAGARVIRQTIGQKLPEGFQSAEFLQCHGFTDRIVKREKMRATLAFLLRSSKEGRHAEQADICKEPRNRVAASRVPQRVSAWERVQRARSMTRPVSGDYINTVFDHFLELHGDRLHGDDRAVIGGVAQIGERYVTVIGEQKGRSAKENKLRNFGMPNPEGYRKALRLIKQAEKFGRPVILFVDTPGAFCGVEAEERGQGEAIARNLFELAGLSVPVLSIIIGEGGSGGALALALANEVWMLENSVYSVLSPEGFAAILWKNGKRAAQAAEVMKLTAEELQRLGVIDKVLSEKVSTEVSAWDLSGLAQNGMNTDQPEIADRTQMAGLAERIRAEILDFLKRYEKKTGEEIRDGRYEKFRSM